MKKTPKNFFKNLLLLTLAVIMSCSAFGCNRPSSSVKIDPTKTQLYIYNYDGGVGSEWLDPLIARFEDANKNESFESGKTGVQVIAKKTKSDFNSLLQTSRDAVFFVQQAYYNQLQSQGKILDITDVVTEMNSDGKTIESKLSKEQKEAFTAYDGNYYVLPHYVLFSSVTYDRDLFEAEKLYINKAGKVATNYELAYDADYEKSNLSVGPDGIGGTYDDGLPSSFVEFVALCEQMVRKDIIPFVFSGSYKAYSTNLINALWAAYTGAQDFYYNFSFDSGDDTTEIVTSFNGNTPVYEEVQITHETAYKLKAQSGKLYALDFFKKTLDENWYSDMSFNSSTSHTDAQRGYIYSYPDSTKKPIAMLLEGTYWYHEANTIIKDAAVKFPHMSERNFAVMPLPTRYDDSTPCKKNTIVDANSSFAFINANVADDPVAVDLAKRFLKFCYTDESLQEFTTVSGTAKGVAYELTDAQYNSLPSYFKSVYDISKNSDVVYPYSDSRIFINNQKAFGFAQDTVLWESGVYGIPLGAMKDSNKSAKEYFEPWIDFETQSAMWSSLYNKYFD